MKKIHSVLSLSSALALAVFFSGCNNTIISAGKSDPNDMLASIVKEFPNASVVLTRGARGAILANRAEKFSIPAIAVNAVDSTAAGDAFIGYFLVELMQGTDAKSALHTACEAAAFCVTRQGAADSIPRRAELESGE